jgi:hypothetical protein
MLPAEHPDVLYLQESLAITRARAGDLPGSRALFERVLAVRTRTLPDDHIELQRARLNLAHSLLELGDFSGARTIGEKVLEVRSRALPEEHPDLQMARGNLAVTLKELGELQAARALQEHVLAIVSRTRPEDHPDHQAALGNLAGTRFALDDVAGARELLEQLLASLERVLPEDHPDLQRARLDLAITLGREGDRGDARERLEQVLRVWSRTLPPEHPDLGRAQLALAETLASLSASALPEGRPDAREHRAELPAARAALATELCRGRTAAARRTWQEGSTREAEERCAGTDAALSFVLSLAQGCDVFRPSDELCAAAFVLCETARGAGLTTAAFARRARNRPESEGTREELRAASTALADLARDGTTSEEFRRALAQREALERRLLALIGPDLEAYARQLQFGVAELAHRLEEGQALVAYRRYARASFASGASSEDRSSSASAPSTVESLCAFVLRSASWNAGGAAGSPVLTLTDLGPMAGIEDSVRAWREGLGVGGAQRSAAWRRRLRPTTPAPRRSPARVCAGASSIRCCPGSQGSNASWSCSMTWSASCRSTPCRSTTTRARRRLRRPASATAGAWRRAARRSNCLASGARG